MSSNNSSNSYPPPTNPLVSALLTDLYQITMTYAYWKTNRHNDPAVFELFFRKNPFGGEFTIFCGLDECLSFLTHFHFSPSDIDYLQHHVPALAHCDAAFFEWLAQLDASEVRVLAMQQGTICFPKVPLMIIEAPLAVGQLVETTLLTLVNFPSLIATNAARMVKAAKAKNHPTTNNPHHHLNALPPQCQREPICVEFGLRRAQGPDGGLSASKYATVGGFAGTSNVQAGKLCGLTVSGTHAHAFVQSYIDLESVADYQVPSQGGQGPPVVLLPRVLEYRQKLTREKQEQEQRSVSNCDYSKTNDGELAAFIAYATAFPDSFLCLIDTYDTLNSGVANFILVALVLDDLGYKPRGIRLDSGDLAYLSLQCAKLFTEFAAERPFMNDLHICASNDINETTLYSLNDQEHAITIYGIGTNLVTCQAQPALGCVYKLVEINGQPRIKLSQEIGKIVIPGKKRAFRLAGADDCPILDLMVGPADPDPVVGERILCRHPLLAHKRAAVVPSQVHALHQVVLERGLVVPTKVRTLAEAQTAVQEQLASFRQDILRPQNPTPYKVSVTDTVFTFLHNLWLSETPVEELH